VREEGSSPAAPGSAATWIAGVLLALVTFAVYSRVTGHEFIVVDDPGYVGHPMVAGGLTAEGVRWAFTESNSANWHPLTWLSHMLDAELFESDAGKHLLVNAGLHALNAALALAALVALTRTRWASLLVAALFALHPQRVESVAWASERKDVLSATFFFLVLLLYARHARAPSAVRLAPVVLAMALGLMAKPMLVTLPFVLLLLDLWPLERFGRERAARLVLEKLPLLALSVASCALTVWAQGAGRALRSEEALSYGARLANAAVAWVAYLGQAVWPAGLSLFYPHPALVDPEGFDVLAAPVLGGALLLVLVLAAAVRARRSCPWVTVGVLWYLGMLVPVLGIVQVGGAARADRYTYLPILGILIALVWGVRALVPAPAARRGLVAAGLVLATAYAGATWRQVGLWRDTGTLLEHAVAVTERNYDAHNNLGVFYLEEGAYDLAIHHFEERLEVHDAVGALVNLGIAQTRKGDRAAATRTFELVVATRKRQFEANRYLGLFAYEAGDFERAVTHLERSVASREGKAETRAYLGAALLGAGRRTEALAELNRAHRRSPSPLTAERLAWLHATSADPELRRPAKALRLAQGLAAAGWRELRTLAAAQAAVGELEEAERTAGRAELAAPAAERPAIARERAEYRSGRALSE
jgi:tetratricopeptide (TPR) repeat protein